MKEMNVSELWKAYCLTWFGDSIDRTHFRRRIDMNEWFYVNIFKEEEEWKDEPYRNYTDEKKERRKT